jgi:hypothetical protein
MNTPSTKPASQEADNRFYVFKCDMFDLIEFKANQGVLKRLSFAVSSKQPIGKGLDMVRVSPFKTVFVVDESRRATIFAITQNAAFEDEAKKKKPPSDPPPPPVDPLCCQSAGCVHPHQCIVTDIDCFCVVVGAPNSRSEK